MKIKKSEKIIEKYLVGIKLGVYLHSQFKGA